MNEIPVRFPPPHPSVHVEADGTRVPVIEHPVIECGMVTRLAGQLVVCVRRKGHPVQLDYAHTNGYKEWAFDEPALHQDADGNWV